MHSKEKRNIGLMGGTFNPIHYGHLLIAENAYEQFQLDEVVFMPTGNSPHKEAGQILRAEDRLHMVRLAIADNPHFSCSDYEIKKNGISYTYLTLQALHGLFGSSACLYFIMGADSLAYFGTWRHPEEISRLCVILVAVRDGLNVGELLPIREQMKQKYGASIQFINTPNFSVSSQIIRQRVAERQTIRYLVPDAVEAYIKQRRFFED